MRVSFCPTRSCVFSTVPLTVSTFELTLPTSVRTNFLVAHAGATATTSARTDAVNKLLRMVYSSNVSDCRTLITRSCRTRDVPAPRMNDQVLLPRANFERVPARARPGLEGDEILMSQFQKQILQCLDGVKGLTGHPHVSA